MWTRKQNIKNIYFKLLFSFSNEITSIENNFYALIVFRKNNEHKFIYL